MACAPLMCADPRPASVCADVQVLTAAADGAMDMPAAQSTTAEDDSQPK